MSSRLRPGDREELEQLSPNDEPNQASPELEEPVDVSRRMAPSDPDGDGGPMIAQLINALVLGSILLLFSLGLSLAWGTLDVLNLAHGALFIFGGYLGYRVGQSAALPFAVVILISMVGAGLAARSGNAS
jgi:hypothetical protein